MKTLLLCLFALLAAAPARAARTIMEQLPASNNTIFVDTQTAQVFIGTNTAQGSAALFVAGQAQFNGVLLSTLTVTQDGAAAPGSLFPNSLAQLVCNGNTYCQVVLQNYSNGANASSDMVFNTDLGTDAAFFMDTGINSSKYSNASMTAELSSAAFVTSSDSDLDIFADTNGTANGGTGRILLGAGGANLANIAEEFLPSGAIVQLSSVTNTSAGGMTIVGPLTAGLETLNSLTLNSAASPGGFILTVSSQNATPILTVSGSGVATFAATNAGTGGGQGATTINGSSVTIGNLSNFEGLSLYGSLKLVNSSPSNPITFAAGSPTSAGFVLQDSALSYSSVFISSSARSTLFLEPSILPALGQPGSVYVGAASATPINPQYPDAEFEIQSTTGGSVGYVLDVSSQSGQHFFTVQANGNVNISTGVPVQPAQFGVVDVSSPTGYVIDVSSPGFPPLFSINGAGLISISSDVEIGTTTAPSARFRVYTSTAQVEVSPNGALDVAAALNNTILPTFTGCGTTPTVTAGSNCFRGSLSMTTGLSSACALTFPTACFAATPFCIMGAGNAGSLLVVGQSANATVGCTTLTTGVATTCNAGTFVSWICFGQ